MTAMTELFDLYLDANIVLAVVAVIWVTVRIMLRLTPLRQAYPLHLRLVYALLAAIALVPFGVLALDLARGAGIVDKTAALNLSDIAVAQFLNGHIAMSPLAFEGLLSWRDGFTHAVVSMSGVVGIAVALALVSGGALVLWRCVQNLRLVHGLITRSYKWRRFGKVEFRLTDETHVPFSTRGLLRHYIVLPSALLAREHDLRVAISHELQHIRQGDLGWALIIEALRPLFFWNPAYLFWRREAERLRELACDQQVLARGRFDVRSYCDCLIRVCRNSLRNDRDVQIGVPAVSLVPMRVATAGCRAASTLESRVLSMLRTPQRTRRRPSATGRAMTGMMTACCVTALLIVAVSAQRSGDWSHDRLMLSTIVNLERLAQHNGSVPRGW